MVLLSNKTSVCHSECPYYDRSDRLLGHGSKTARIMIVDESPSEAQVIKNSSYAGRGGRLLRGLLKQVGIDEKDVYITRTVQCCTPKVTRLPKKVVNLCAEQFLKEEIKDVEPEIILALGTSSVSFLSPGATSVKGKLLHLDYSEEYNCEIIYTYSPDNILYNLSYLPLLRRSLEMIKDRLEFGDQRLVKTDYKIINNLEELKQLKDFLDNEPFFSSDIETGGFDFFDDVVLCIGVCWKEGVSRLIPLTRKITWFDDCTECSGTGETGKRVKKTCKVCKGSGGVEDYVLEPFFRDDQEEALEVIGQILQNKSGKIFQNYKFDMKFLMTLNLRPTNVCFDTMLAHYLLNENLPHDLSLLARLYTEMGGYDQELEELVGTTKVESYADLPEDLLHTYLCGDVDTTFRLFKRFSVMINAERELDFFKYERELLRAKIAGDKKAFRKQLKDLRVRIDKINRNKRGSGLRRVLVNILLPLQELLGEVEHWGVLIDKSRLTELYTQKKQLLEKLEFEMEKAAGEKINPRSPKQLKDLLFTKFGLPVVKSTPSGQPSTDVEVLTALQDRHPFVKLLLQYRTEHKLFTTYITGLGKLLEKRDTIHTSYFLHGTHTGRLSSANPNLQNIPKNSVIEELFIPRPGYKFAGADYSQAEFRVLADVTGDENLIKDFNEEKDIHAMIASRAFDLSYEDILKEKKETGDCKERTIAKGIGFGMIYGRTAFSLADQLDISVEEAESFMDRFFNANPLVKTWIRAQHEQMCKHGFLRSKFGRIRRLPEIDTQGLVNEHDSKVMYEVGLTHPNITDVFEPNRRAALRQSQNFPIQSTASDITCLAMIRLWERIKNEDLGIRILMNIHDAIYFEISEDNLEENLRIIKEVMLDPVPEKLGGKLQVPLKVDLAVGDGWGSLQENIEDYLEKYRRKKEEEGPF